LVSTYNELIKSNTVVRQVISNLGIPELEENSVRKNISVESVEDTEVIKITVTNENPIYAAKIANEIVKVFTEQIVGEYYNIDNVHVVDEAEVAAGPSNINHAKDVAIFLFIGIILAGAYIFILYMLDTTVKEAEDIEKIVELPVLASIPVYDLGNDKGGKR
jgi:capsular polysaccharide biosynthesis protein